ncbi:hypothetical protein SBA3_1240014 [Candidatus Sulfopaludibacter sp. SbA3]|nr:hypothetical protein SBA3_1240014 [Candidatus Sulfopaludibacter sp. SbA3]
MLRFCCVFHLMLGRIPSEAAFDQKGRPHSQTSDRQPISFRRGQTMAIRLGDYIDQIKANVEPGIPLSVATKLIIDFGAVIFADGMMGTESFGVFDPKTRTWQRMDRDFFPGDMDRYWPGQPGWPERQ